MVLHERCEFLPRVAFPPAFLLQMVAFSGHLQSEYSREEALKIVNLINDVQREQLIKKDDDTRSVTVTENEINSYIAFRIETEKEEVLKELRLKLFDNNYTEWMIMLDLEGANLPKILKPHMTFFMGGVLEVKDGQVRLNMKDLFLENQRIQVAVFDLVIFIGSRFLGSEPFSMNDWWDLPYGIKDFKTQIGKATFYY